MIHLSVPDISCAHPPSDFIEALEEVGYASFVAQG